MSTNKFACTRMDDVMHRHTTKNTVVKAADDFVAIFVEFHFYTSLVVGRTSKAVIAFYIFPRIDYFFHWVNSLFLLAANHFL